MMPRLIGIALMAAVMTVVTVVSAFASPRPVHHGSTGWAGYPLYSQSRISADFIVPNVSGSEGQSVAYWAGFGQGSLGIQQAGIAGTVGHGWSAWWEMWPADGHSFTPPVPPHSGDLMQFVVTFGQGVYTLEVNDVTRGWSQSTRQLRAQPPEYGELIAEKYGPDLPANIGASKFFYASSPLSGSPWVIPGTSLQKLSSTSFTFSKP